MKLLPAEVQQCFPFVLFTVGGASDALLEKTVIGMQSSSAIHREVTEVGVWMHCFVCRVDYDA